MNDLDARRYTIKAVLGKGGYGKVYHAIMEGAGGFSKDVAIKLLNSEGVPELTLQRFRDEARILGLVRDRAIVNVDPPTRLAGRWAVVMEYVDGASLQRLIQLGPIPAGVVAEIVQEVARALDTVYRQPGPDGKPLCLLHRDIKPGNLQVTPDGGVKILDFGIARADFARREAETEAYIGGTRGFIAPERLDGMERPEGDIFSLGITAHCMLFGQRPTKHQMMGLAGVSPPSKDPAERALVTLFTQMRSVDPDERPTAREVEDRCGQIRHHSNDMSLRRWAERHVPRAMQLSADDAMVGSVLTETLAAMPSEERIASGRELFASTAERPRASRRRPRMRHVLLFGGLVLGTGALALTSAITAGVVLILQSGGLSSSEMVIPVEYDGPSSEPVPRIERSISSTAPRPADPGPNEDASEAAAANSADANPGDPPLPPPDPQAGESGGAVTTKPGHTRDRHARRLAARPGGRRDRRSPDRRRPDRQGGSAGGRRGPPPAGASCGARRRRRRRDHRGVCHRGGRAVPAIGGPPATASHTRHPDHQHRGRRRGVAGRPPRGQDPHCLAAGHGWTTSNPDRHRWGDVDSNHRGRKTGANALRLRGG